MTKMMISARVEEKLNADLERIAANSKRSKAFLITEALEDYIERQTWVEQKIDAAFQEADASGEFISHEAMEAWLLSWGTENELPPPKPDVFKSRSSQ